MEKTSTVNKKSWFRPWLWPVRFLGKFWKSPVPPGLWLVNIFFQRVLDINNDVPWMVHYTSKVTCNVTIGKNVWKYFAISGGCYIQGGNGIYLGDDTIVAPGVKIISANHNLVEFNKWDAEKPVRIGKHCWIGTNAVILPGVHLGDHTIVGAGAVVTKSFSNGYCIIGGNPAKVIKELKKNDLLTTVSVSQLH
jgi:acetyltransferase-like isoleucine patch superfamily enzyme